MKKNYIKAILEMFERGDKPTEVLSGLKNTLETKGHMSLYGSILHGVLTQLEARNISDLPQVTVYSESDQKNQKKFIEETLKELGAESKYEATVDESIIGGHVVAYNNMLVDKSYKTSLTKLYRSITK